MSPPKKLQRRCWTGGRCSCYSSKNVFLVGRSGGVSLVLERNFFPHPSVCLSHFAFKLLRLPAVRLGSYLPVICPWEPSVTAEFGFPVISLGTMRSLTVFADEGAFFSDSVSNSRLDINNLGTLTSQLIAASSETFRFGSHSECSNRPLFIEVSQSRWRLSSFHEGNVTALEVFI